MGLSFGPMMDNVASGRSTTQSQPRASARLQTGGLGPYIQYLAPIPEAETDNPYITEDGPPSVRERLSWSGPRHRRKVGCQGIDSPAP